MRSAILLSSILAATAMSAHGTFTLDSLLPPNDAIRDLPPAFGAPLHASSDVLAALFTPDSEPAWVPSRPYTAELGPLQEDTSRPGSPDYTGPMLGFLEFHDILPPDDFDIVTQSEELAELLSGRAPPPEIPPPQPLPEPEFLAAQWRVPCPAYPLAPVVSRDPPTDPKAPPAVAPPPAPTSVPQAPPPRIMRPTHFVDQPITTMLAARSLELRISYRMGRLRSGLDDFWGLDQPAMRIGVDYGATGRLTLGLGRSSTDKSIDLHGKLLLLREGGAMPLPLTAALDASFEYSLAPAGSRRETPGTRSSWLASLLLAHEAGSRTTVQIAPGLAHVGRNEREGEPLTWGIAAAMLRFRLAPSVHLGAEAAWPLNGLSLEADAPGRGPSLSAGIEIATASGTFLMHVGNSLGQTPLDAARFNAPLRDIGLGLNYLHGWEW